MRPLVQLSNGDWVDPTQIRAITILEKMFGRPDRVAVFLKNYPTVVCPFSSFEAAAEYRDSLAVAVNRREDAVPPDEGGTP